MEVDLIVAVGVFLIMLILSIIAFLNYVSNLPKTFSVGYLRESALRLADEFLNEAQLGFSYSNPSLLSKIYRIPVKVEETAGLARTNEPVYANLTFDKDCLNKSRNVSVRVYDTDLNGYNFTFNQPTYCIDNFLKFAEVGWAVNLSANQAKIFFIYFSNSSVSWPNYTFEENTSSWVPSDGDAWTEALTDWSVLGTGALALSETRKVGSYSVMGNGSYSEFGLTYNPSSAINGVSNGWYLRAWVYANDTTNLQFYLNLSDGSEQISLNLTDQIEQGWNLVEKELAQPYWQGWTNFNASKGIDFVTYYGKNSTAGLASSLAIDGLRFEKPPLSIKVFPTEELEIVSSEKLNELKDTSYQLLSGALGSKFRIEVTP